MTADWLNEMTVVFGKPAAIKVEIEGDIILNQGEFAPPRRFFNGKLRAF